MIRIGKKFLKPHLCPTCCKPVLLVRHPLAVSCSQCRNKRHRKTAGQRKLQKRYCASYKHRRRDAISEHPYCALCGCTKDLTCHHAVRVRSGEWKGKHLTVLCERCHNLWEQKVNKIRAMEIANEK